MDRNDNPYAPPSASLVDAPDGAAANHGSVETALSGDYHVDIGHVVREAWALVEGSKIQFLLAVLVILGLSGGSQIIFTAVGFTPEAMGLDGFLAAYGFGQVQGLVMLPLIAPLYAGVGMMGAHRAAGHDVNVGSLFSWYRFVVPLTVLGAGVSIATMLGYALLILPGVYLAIGLMFANLLVVDKGMTVGEAAQTSLKAVHHHWFEIFATSLVLGLIMGFSAILFLIPLFWTLPLVFIGSGVLYRTIFGVTTPPA